MYVKCCRFASLMKSTFWLAQLYNLESDMDYVYLEFENQGLILDRHWCP